MCFCKNTCAATHGSAGKGDGGGGGVGRGWEAALVAMPVDGPQLTVFVVGQFQLPYNSKVLLNLSRDEVIVLLSLIEPLATGQPPVFLLWLLLVRGLAGGIPNLQHQDQQ